MVKEVDTNGFWRIKDNPLSKEGVFPYLGKQIDKSLEPDKIYWVYRPMSEIANPETVESFNAAPLIDEHEMLGEGWTKYDDRPAGGVVYNTHARDGKLYGDIRIYSEKLKDEIESGKKELSMGYECNYEPAEGYFDGKKYDFIQKNLRGNHIALVNRGRMGSDVRVYDHFTFDTLEGIGEFEKTVEIEQEPEIKPVDVTVTVIDEEIPSQDGSPKESGVDSSFNIKGEDTLEKVDKRKGISEVEAMLYEAKKDPAKLTDELIKTILQKMENNSYKASEKTKADDEDIKEEEKSEDEAKSCKDGCEAEDGCKTKDECGAKEDEAKDESGVAKENAEGEAPTEEKKDEGKKAEDAALAVMDALPEILASLNEIKASLAQKSDKSEPEVMYGLDEAPAYSKNEDKVLKKYLGEI